MHWCASAAQRQRLVAYGPASSRHAPNCHLISRGGFSLACIKHNADNHVVVVAELVLILAGILVALAMAGVFMKTNSTEEALKVIPLMLAKKGGGGSSEEELQQLMRQAQEILAQTSDATDPDG